MTTLRFKLELEKQKSRRLLRALQRIAKRSTHINDGVNFNGDLQISEIWTIADNALK